ncbi:Homeodomain-like protein, partial [Mycena alexandri]
MGFRHISRDVKIAALNLYEHGRLTLPEILQCVGFSERTFYRILHLWRTTGDVVTYKKSRGRPRILHHDDVQYLLRLVKHSPDWFLDELLELLKTNRFISVHFTTIHRALERAGLSTKDLKFVADERSE